MNIEQNKGTDNLVIENGVLKKIKSTEASIIIPDGIREISDYAAYECTEIKTVIIPNSVKKIGEYAFCSCKNLECVSIPDSVEFIGSGILFGTKLYNNPQNWKQDVLYVDNHLADTRNTLSGNYKIKEGTLTIAKESFVRCVQLTGIVIPNTVKRIEAFVFHGCSSLCSVKLPDNIEYISDYAFKRCKAPNPVPFLTKKG